MCKPRKNKGKGKNQNEQAESEADSEHDGNKRMHGFFLQKYRLDGLERHFLRKHLADLVNHLSSAFHLQAVVQFQIYELLLMARHCYLVILKAIPRAIIEFLGLNGPVRITCPS